MSYDPRPLEEVETVALVEELAARCDAMVFMGQGLSIDEEDGYYSYTKGPILTRMGLVRGLQLNMDEKWEGAENLPPP